MITGNPVDRFDALLAFIETTGVDGFNLSFAVWPESFGDFVDLDVPELQNRGRYRTGYDPAPCVTNFKAMDPA